MTTYEALSRMATNDSTSCYGIDDKLTRYASCGWDGACGMQPQSSKCVLTIQTNFRKCEQANNFFFFFCFILLRGTALDGMNKSHSES